MAGINIGKLNLAPGIGKLGFVGIDLSASNLKICYFRVSSGKKELAALLIRNTNGLSEDEIAKSSLLFIREQKIKKPYCVLCISSQLVITKNIEVPSVDPKEIREIINLQAGRHTPYSREEVIVDYILIGTYKQNYTKVLLLIVNSSVIKKQFVILDKAGIKVEKAVLMQEGLAAFAAKAFKFDSAGVTAFILVDDIATEFSIFFKNKVIFIRAIPIGRQHLMIDREKASQKFFEEVKKSLDSYQVENIEKPPSTLILTGALEGVDNFDVLLGAAVNIPVRGAPYLAAIPFANKFSPAAEEIKGASFLNVAAPLLSLGECRANLIPEEVKVRMGLAHRGKDLMITAVAVLLIAVLFFIMMMTGVYFKNAYLKKLEDKYRNLGSEAERLEKVFQKNNQIRGYLATRGVSIKVLTELYNLAPLDLELNYIKYEKDGKFSVRGTAESRSTIFSFVDSMEKSPYFKDVKNKNTTKRQEGQKEVTDFEINCVVTNKAGQ
ncbi:MAG: PilN domain-containing protein [Candidatus Omnitrophota bacterium]